MNKIVTGSIVVAVAITSVNASGLTDRLNALESEIADLKKKVKKQNRKINKVKAHDAGDNIKWGVDFRTAMDKIKYDMADGSTREKKALFTNRLWLNMEYSPNPQNVFKGQLSMYKAYGADFGQREDLSLNGFGFRGAGFDTFDWITNEALRDGRLSVRQAYWLYLGEKFLGADIPWSFSLGRRPSTGGFLANLRNDDIAQSPLGHIINVEFDGLSSKLDLSNITGVPGMSFKICMGLGSTNAVPRLGNLSSTDYSKSTGKKLDGSDILEDTQLAGFIFEPYNDGQFIVKTTAFKAFNMPGFDSPGFAGAFQGGKAGFSQNGNMLGAAISVMVDGLTEEGFLADTKIFGSFAWSETDPDGNKYMLGLDPTALRFPAGSPGFGAKEGEAKSGTSYWIGAQIPVTEDGVFGLEYNHGSQYWRPFDYGEDTLGGSKLATRGDAIEAYFTYQINDALSAQVRYTRMDYDYAGSNGFFGSGGTPIDIDKAKAGASAFKTRGVTQADLQTMMVGTPNMAVQQAIGGIMEENNMEMTPKNQQVAGGQLAGEALNASFASAIVDKAEDFRFYLRYRF